uniref:Uncharacterized protein n=1 Tax=Lepeophtheirus salmonis TaxID=72036 RepID=A0A0K2T614_LEPSM
MWQEIPLCRE